MRHARLVADGRRALTLRLVTNGPAQLELWGLENRRASMEKALGRRLSVEVETDAGRRRTGAGRRRAGGSGGREGDRARREGGSGGREAPYSSPTTFARRRLKPSPRICVHISGKVSTRRFSSSWRAAR